MFLSLLRWSWLVSGAALTSLSVHAQNFVVLEETLRQHPSLVQLEHQALASREHATASYALPDPKLSLGVNNLPLNSLSFDRYLPTNKAIGLVQSIPNRAARSARRARMQESASQFDALVEAHYAELRGQLIAQLLHLKRIEQQRALANARYRKYDELANVVMTEIDAGRPALYRLAEIESERAEVAGSLVNLEGQAAQLHVSLVEKLGFVPDTPPPAVEQIIWSGEPRDFHAVRVASMDTSIADAGLDEAKASWKTNWGVHLTYQQRSSGRGGPDSTFGGDDWFSAGVSFTLPVWGKRKQAPNVRAAMAERSSAHLHEQALAQQSIARFNGLRAEQATAEANRRVLLEKISAMRSEIAAQQTHYESGEGDYAPIIDGEIAILTLQAQIAAEKTRALSAIARSNALLVTP